MAKPDRPEVLDALWPDASLQEVGEAALTCRNCPLHRTATTTVFSEGPAPAPLMWVGEQPGDRDG
jgi:uracil-DNA glycosylase